ncbi:unnamed protein product [Trichobilharzia szidati]|nr:unnamed protein product [Trichobilharzia szidati]
MKMNNLFLVFSLISQLFLCQISAHDIPHLASHTNSTSLNDIEWIESTLEAEIQKLLLTYVRTERPRNKLLMSTSNVSEVKSNQNLYTGPLIVEVNTFIHSFSSISVVNMDFTVDFMLRQRWLDTRLKIPGKHKFTHLPISYAKNSIWIPDLFFRNAKHGFLHDMTTPNYLIWIDSDGLITFSQKISMKLSCHMILHTFPFDTQHCTMNIGSYGYSKSDLDFRWWNADGYDQFGTIPTSNKSKQMAVQIRSGLEINEFDLLSYETNYCNMEYSTTGQFSCLEAVFYLKRRFGFYLIYAYLPSLLLVIIAWLSFFVDYEAVPARISIGLLCVLALITQSAAILTQVPRVSYTKGIDIWLFVCLAFVVSSLLEFAIANSLARKRIKPATSDIVKYVGKDCMVLTTCDALSEFLSKQNNQITNRNSNDDKSDLKPFNNETECSQSLINSPELNTSKRSEVRSWDSSPISCHQKLITLSYKSTSLKKPSVDKSFFLDRAWAIIYPIIFGIFNAIYWIYFLKYQ